MPFLLDEAALRRPVFDLEGSAPIVLRDGQAWYFRKPWIEYTSRMVDGKITFNAEYTYDELIESFEASETVSDVIERLHSLSIAMLSPNYDMTHEQFASILKTRKNHEGDQERWHEIVGVARGIGPKQSDDGGESPPSPSVDSEAECS